MKKKIIILLMISLGLCPMSFNQVSVSDCFETGDFTASNWAATGNAQISTESPYEGSYCVKGPSTWKLEQVFNSISDNVVVTEFAMKASQTGSNCIDMRVYDVNDVLIANVFFRHTGNIEAYDGYNNNLPLMSYSANTWYLIKMIMNVQDQSYDVYIDNVLMADDFEFYNITNSAPKTFFWRSMETWGTGWVDCIDIYGEPQLSELPVSDCFETGDFTASNWAATGNAQISTESPYEGSYCVKGPSTWKLEQVFNSISDNVVVTEFAMKASQTGSNCVDMRVYDVNDLLIANVFFRHTGYIESYDGYQGANVSVPVMPYTANTWYKIKMIMDIQDQAYDIYIDDVLMADDFEFYNITNSAPKTFYWRSMESWGTGWVDCIDIYANTGSSITSISATPSLVCSGEEVQLTSVVSGQNYTYSWTSDPAGFTSDQSDPVVYPTTSTTYTLTITDNFGSDSKSVYVEVNTVPIANAGVDETIYIGYAPESTQLNASGGIQYSWSPTDGLSDPSIPNPIANPGVSTLYTVTVTDSNGCIATDEVFIIVVDCVCGNTGNNILMCHTPGNSGIKKTVCISPNAVPAMLAQGATLGPCPKSLEIEPEFIVNFTVNVYPNPTSDNFQVDISIQSPADTYVEIIDVLGRSIIKQQLGTLAEGKHTIPFHLDKRLSSNLYFLRVISGNKNKTVTLIR